MNVREALAYMWKMNIGNALPAYNCYREFNYCGRTIHFFGIEANVGQADPHAWHGWKPEGWLYIRWGTNGALNESYYSMQKIVDFDDPDKIMVSVRTIMPSPFYNEKGKVIYAGGFDCSFQSCHNTGWLYRGEILE